MWWTANTSAHNFVHRPFFPWPAANAGFSILLSVVMGVPQTLWRERHLAHHAGRRLRFRPSRRLFVELAVLVAGWMAMGLTDPVFLLAVYGPGWALGLGLCTLQGHFEHARGATSHYGRLYNVVCFNDGYHVEHHAHPGVHWARLPGTVAVDTQSSRWPPLLRWLDLLTLDALERLVLRSPVLQRRVLACHRRAFVRLLRRLSRVDSVAIVGGGLFPRTALILRQLLPSARIVIIDANPEHLSEARAQLDDGVTYQCRRYPGAGDALAPAYDLLVIPLAFDGDREKVYERGRARAIAVHDWIWRPRGCSCIVSIALLKRLNLVMGRT
jgi:Fatty acid desaturase